MFLWALGPLDHTMAISATQSPDWDADLDVPPKYEARGQVPIFSEKTTSDDTATKKKLMDLVDTEKKLVMDMVQLEGDKAWRHWTDREGMYLEEFGLLSFCRLERSKCPNLRLTWEMIRFEARTRILELKALEKRCKKELKTWRSRQQEIIAGDYTTKKMLVQTGQITEDYSVIMWSRKVRADMDGMMKPLRDLELWFEVMPFRGESPVPRSSRLMGLARAVWHLPPSIWVGLELVFGGRRKVEVSYEDYMGDKAVFAAVGRWKDEAEATGRRPGGPGTGFMGI